VNNGVEKTKAMKILRLFGLKSNFCSLFARLPFASFFGNAHPLSKPDKNGSVFISFSTRTAGIHAGACLKETKDELYQDGRQKLAPPGKERIPPGKRAER
jgi:hypothetical protein